MTTALQEREALTLTAPRAEVSSQARGFCEREGLQRELAMALELIKRHFPSVRLTINLVSDMEGDEEWVSTHVVFAGSRDDFHARYQAYIRDWIAATRWPESHKIRFSYGIV